MFVRLLWSHRAVGGHRCMAKAIHRSFEQRSQLRSLCHIIIDTVEIKAQKRTGVRPEMREARTAHAVPACCATPHGSTARNLWPTLHKTSARSSFAPGFPPPPRGISGTPRRDVWLICPETHQHPRLHHRHRELLLPEAWARRLSEKRKTCVTPRHFVGFVTFF